MKVYVLVKMEGTSAAQDGHTVIGVFKSHREASKLLTQSVTTREPASWYKITEHELD